MTAQSGRPWLAAVTLAVVFALGVLVGTRVSPPATLPAAPAPATAAAPAVTAPVALDAAPSVPALDATTRLRRAFDAAVSDRRPDAVAALGRQLVLEHRETGPEILTAIESAAVALARSAAARNDLAALQRHLDAADEVLGGSVERTLLRATALLDADRHLEAARAIQDARYWWHLDDPRLVTLQHRCFGAAVAAAGSDGAETTGAIAILREAVEYEPTHADYHARLGRLLQSQSRYDDATAALERALQLDPALAPELAALLERTRIRAALPPSVRIAVQRSGETTLVPVTVNGDRRLTLVLDTGSSYTALSRSALRALGDAPARGSVRLATANGMVDAPLVALTSVAVGAAVIPALDAVILDGFGPHDGLLGMNYLRHFEVELSSRDGELLLRRR